MRHSRAVTKCPVSSLNRVLSVSAEFPATINWINDEREDRVVAARSGFRTLARDAAFVYSRPSRLLERCAGRAYRDRAIGCQLWQECFGKQSKNSLFER